MFFSDNPKFYESSTIVSDRLPDGSPSPRLENRYRGIIHANRELFEDARVLDIGCHDGRWGAAALDAGARYVFGLEGRPETLEKARQNFRDEERSKYSFQLGDALEVLRGTFGPFDLILCLGFMYHTPHHVALFEHFRRLSKNVILDTKVNTTPNPATSYMAEPVEKKGCAIPTFGDRAVIGVPSVSCVEFLAKQFEFNCVEIDWKSLQIKDWRRCEDYRDNKRKTWVLKSNAH